ncbi:hypothetical protein MNEG_15951 [Monoraphidium neglectum]|uniref:Uncharacterized protein n=1 Tax=Monoraphidium neglectum TaxID=145388 RepID=A0A0D2IVQ1_9CHLO|nr:hypothetical protein MNEG_15951 [Monoraphidium neglectum]KIY92012.1 hypothetical protein MNEG_15951 [Monoraphidium neglectum]|eukprot:XP_013891032.1 hypothetical protein MNEG_15951 [Monoraphidium neglectum]
MQALPAFAAVRKENALAAGVWAGARLQQDASMAPLGPPKLEVCPDDEFLEQERAEQEAEAAAAAAAARACLQRQQVMKGAGGAAAAAAAGRGPGLRPMPLAPVDAALAALPPPVVPVLGSAALSAAPSGGKIPGCSGGSSSSAAAGSGVSGGYEERLLVGPDGREQCFEEARAAAWLARQPALKAQQDLPTQQQQQQQEEVCRLDQEVQQQQQQQQQERQQQLLQQEAPQRRERPAELAPAAATAQPAVLAADLAPQDVTGAVGANADDAPQGGAATHSTGPSTGVATALCDQQEQQQQQQQQVQQQEQQEQQYQQQQQPQERRRRTSRLSMGPLAGAGVGAEPTMTMSTKAALASLNRMFNSDFTASVAPSPHVARGGRMSMAAGRPGDGGGGGWGGGAEPTATMQTREALSLVNDLFCDEAPGAAGDLTQRFPRGRQSGAAGLYLYEDTEFISRADAAGAAAARMRAGRRSSVAPPAGGMALYQDTEFLTRPVGGAGAGAGAGGGLGLYEDTEFITRPVGAAGVGAGSGHGGSGSGSGGLGLYEDTEFVTRPAAPPAGGGVGQGPGLCMHQDTEFLTGHVAATLAQQQGRATAAAGGGARGGGCDPDSTQGLVLSKENRLPPPAQAGAEPSADAAAARREQLGSPGRPPRAAVAGGFGAGPGTPGGAGAALSARCDSFEVMDSPAGLRERLAARARAGSGGGSLPSTPSPDKVGGGDGSRPCTAAPTGPHALDARMNLPFRPQR